MLFISLKVAVLVGVLRIAQEGNHKSALKKGAALAVFFSMCSFVASGFTVGVPLVELMLGLLLCPLILLLYWKQDGVVLSLVVAGASAIVLVLIVPMLAFECVGLFSTG